MYTGVSFFRVHIFGSCVLEKTPSLLSYTLRYVSFGEVGSVCRVPLWEPMHLCTCVSEEGGDGEDVCSGTSSLCTCVSEEGDDGESVCSETPSLLSYTLRYVRCLLWIDKTRAKNKTLWFIMNQSNEKWKRLILEYRCDERLKTKNEESTRLTDTGLVVELEHLKTKTRLIDEKFVSVRGECET